MLNQKLQQKLQQKLSPQQIQLIKLLELPSLQLEQRIKKEIEENPALEEGAEKEEMEVQEEEPVEDSNDDEFSLEDYIADDDIPDYKLSANNYSKDDKPTDIPIVGGISFFDFLTDQLLLKNIDEKTSSLAQYLIGSLDEDGYLRRDLEDIVDDLAFSMNISVDSRQLEKALKVLQTLDPVGVGARDLQECLLIQLEAKEHLSFEVKLAKEIIKHHFQSFSRKHYDKIIAKLEIDEPALKDALEIILKLNPRPGGSISGTTSSTQAIIPDFLVNISNGNIELNLTSRNAPELHVSRQYSEMIKAYQADKNPSKKQKETVMFVKQKLDSAKWFIDAIRQRQNTLLNTMRAIINHQEKFFMEGDVTDMKPMILKDIADVTGLDISTISRVANSKYVQTPYGNYPLKYFFSEGIQNEEGEEVSTRQIKQILQDVISEEDKKKPLTDEKLASILKEKGFPIARRTIAKYRETLNIPVARMRKEL